MSADGRLDLDDLGQVIEQASSLDEVVGTEDPRPTLHERLEAAGVLPWVRRHRAALGGAAAALVSIGAFAWWRHDPRPPDDGLPHVAVVDALSNPGITNDVPGLLSTIYTLVGQRAGDTVSLLGITGPGIRATSVGRPVVDSGDDARSSTPVLAVLGCDDPRALDAGEDDYRLLVRRTDSYGRTVEAQLPLPVGSQFRWGLTVGSTCLQSLAAAHLSVRSVRAAAVPGRAQVVLDVEVRSTLERDLALDTLGYPGMSVRPDSSSTTIPAGETRTLHVTESVENCADARLQGGIFDTTGQMQYGVDNRTLDVYVRVLTASPDMSSAGISLPWSRQMARPVTGAFAAACAGMPRHDLHVVSTSLAPVAVREAAASRNGDPSTMVLRTTVDVGTDASAVTVADVMSGENPDYGGFPQLTVVDVATGEVLPPTTPAGPVRVVDGRARVVLDWTLACSGAYSPPTARVVLARGSRSWSLLLNIDDRLLADGVSKVCPGVTMDVLQSSGWMSLQPPTAG